MSEKKEQKCKMTTLIKYSTGILIVICFAMIACFIWISTVKLNDITVENTKLKNSILEIEKRNSYPKKKILEIQEQNQNISKEIELLLKK